MYTEKGESPRAEDQPLWHVDRELAPQGCDIQIAKYHADSFVEMGLEQELQNKQATNLVFCGVQTEYGVDTTLKSAFSPGFSSALVSDAHSTYDSDSVTA
jgi:nicotinamidase-related amidase